MKCMMNECPGYEAGGYCTIYDIHVNSGDDCPIEDEYTENEEDEDE